LTGHTVRCAVAAEHSALAADSLESLIAPSRNRRGDFLRGAIHESRDALIELFLTFARVGATTFGMTMLQEIRRVSLARDWVTSEVFDRGVALVQIYPGPMMVDLVAFVGYRRAGVAGAVCAVTGFVLPASALMLALAAIYFRLGEQAWVGVLSVGLAALVTGLTADMAWSFARQHVETLTGVALMLFGMAPLLLGIGQFWPILAGLLVGAIAIRPARIHAESEPRTSPPLRMGGPLAAAAAIVVALAALSLIRGSLGDLALEFAHIGALAFGNGSTILPLLQHTAVNERGWLSFQDFAVGLAFGQVTPGPILNTATFIGYAVADWPGAIVATFAIFAPTFAMTLVFTELFERIHAYPWVSGAAKGVLAAFAGLLVAFVFRLGASALINLPACLFAIGAIAASRLLKWTAPLVLGAGILGWMTFSRL
jgi:chromate transporter